MQHRLNVYLYLGFILLGAYSFFSRQDWRELALHWGVAFLFDPFKVDQPWQERPKWQRGVLLIQLAIVLFAFVYTNFPDILQGWKDGYENR